MLQGNLTSDQINDIEFDFKKIKTEKYIQQPFIPNKKINLSNTNGNTIFNSFSYNQNFVKSKVKSFISFQPSKKFGKYFSSISYPKINENEKSDIETKSSPEKSIEVKYIDLNVLYNKMLNEVINIFL